MALALSGVTAACDRAEPEPELVVSAADEASAPVAEPPAPAEDEPASTLSGPPTGLIPPAPGDERVVGTVVEHLPTGNYHYLRVAPSEGEPRWVVTMGGEYREGVQVEVDSFGARHDFYSRRLDRRFDELVFGMVAVMS